MVATEKSPCGIWKPASAAGFFFLVAPRGLAQHRGDRRPRVVVPAKRNRKTETRECKKTQKERAEVAAFFRSRFFVDLRMDLSWTNVGVIPFSSGVRTPVT